MANGRVITGFSMPRVALYTESSGTITYSGGIALARGVDVTLTPDDQGDDNIFYADNVAAERVAGVFTGGTLTLHVDGLQDAARALIMGLPSPTSVTVDGNTLDVYEFNDDQSIPYVGVGFIVRYMEEGVTTYVPTILKKCRFDQIGDEAATQEEDIDWQTTELEATMLRADDSGHSWFKVWAAQDSEAKALAILDDFLNVS